MGLGMAETIAGKGLDVILLDQTEEDLERAKDALELALQKRLAKWGITEAEKKGILSRITMTTEWEHLRDCDLVVESVWEVLEDKAEVLQAIEAVVSPETVIGSNTATLSITEMAAYCEHSDRIIGMHFHYPVVTREVVEVVRGLKTTDRTVAHAEQFIRSLEKTPVRVFESPGYITARLMMPVMNEAVNLLSEGVASKEDIDTAMKAGYGFTLGPLELADRFGLDTLVHMLDVLFRETADPRYRPSAHLRKLVRAGRLGIKTREGFYQYDELGDKLEGGVDL